MKRYIRSSMNPDVLSSSQKEEIAAGLLKIVERYFHNEGYGRPSPRVSYSQYDIKEYTFRINSGSYSSDVDYVALVDGDYSMVDLNAFRSEVRSYLKSFGFKKVTFDLGSFKRKGDQYTGYYRPVAPTYTYKELNAIYFGA